MASSGECPNPLKNRVRDKVIGLPYLEFSEPPDACLATRAGSAAGRPSCDSRCCGGVEFSPGMAVALSAPAPWVRAAGRGRTPPPGVCMHTAWMVSMALLNASRLLATTSWLRSTCRQEGRHNGEFTEHGISRSHRKGSILATSRQTVTQIGHGRMDSGCVTYA